MHVAYEFPLCPAGFFFSVCFFLHFFCCYFLNIIINDHCHTVAYNVGCTYTAVTCLREPLCHCCIKCSKRPPASKYITKRKKEKKKSK